MSTPISPTPDSAEAVNVRIAELCGFQWYSGGWGNGPHTFKFLSKDGSFNDGYIFGKPCDEKTNGLRWLHQSEPIPNYSGSLDAMHEAVASLSPTLRIAFASVLFDVCGSWAAAVNSTPTQRAAAFLRVANH